MPQRQRQQTFDLTFDMIREEITKDKPDIYLISAAVGHIWEASGMSEKDIAESIGIQENLINKMLTVADETDDIIRALGKDISKW